MKKTISSLIILCFLFGGLSALAQTTSTNPGLTPDSPFYFLKTWKENIQTFFTFGAENKAKQYLHLADVRLAEYQKMIEMGKTEIAQKTLDKYQKQLDHALQKIEELKNKGKNVESLKQQLEEKNNKKETADWQTYTNDSYGFEIKYPSQLTRNVISNSGGALFSVGFWDKSCSTECSSINVSVSTNNNKTFEEIKKSAEERYTTLLSQQVSLSETTIDGKRAFITPPYETGLGGVTIVDTNYIYSISRNAPWQKIGSNEISETTFNQMLSTFKFIEKSKDETADWQTYTDLGWGYEFRYPSNINTLDLRLNAKESFNSLTNLKVTDSDPGYENCDFESAGCGGGPNCIMKGKRIKINDIDFCLLDNQDQGAGHVQIDYTYIGKNSYNGKYYTITLKSEAVSEAYCAGISTCISIKDVLNLFNQMLSTFKFIGTSTNETADQEKHRTVELKDVINHYDASKNNYIKTNGIILGLEYNNYGGSILLADGPNNDYFLLVTICHACVANYKDILSSLQRGDRIQVSGIASFTAPRDLNLVSKFNLSYSPSFPETIGMVNLDPADSSGIKKIVKNEGDYNHAGTIINIYQKDGKNYLDINFIKFVLYKDSTAVPAYIYGENDEKGSCEPGPDGYCVVDNDKTTKSYEVAKDVEIIPANYPGLPITFDKLAETIKYSSHLFELQIKDNIITKMSQIYTP